MKRIELTNGGFAIVDDDDFARLSAKAWYRQKSKGYAYRYEAGRTLYMHREIVGTPPGMETDHVNRNRLDNRRANLRAVSRGINKLNSGVWKNNRSGVKGVGWYKRLGKWRARVRVNYKEHNLGFFDSIEDASRARSEFLVSIGLGEFA